MKFAHQEADVARLREALGAPGARVLYVAFMGSGKTVVGGEIAADFVARGKRVLWLAHRRVLMAQTDRRLRDWLTSADIGWIWGRHGRTKPEAMVQLASVDTLVRREMPDGIDLIVIDEAHHAAAAKWQTVLGWAKPGTPVLGLTATPERLDGKPLGGDFDTMIEAPDPETLIEAGTIQRAEVWTRPDGLAPDMSGADKRNGDWTPASGARAMSAIVGDLFGHWKRHAEGRPTVGFLSLVSECKRMVRLFREHGVRTEVLIGKTSEKDREAIMARLASGVTRVVWTCDALGEGWDYQGVRCVIVARPTLSLTRYLQWCGRAMRAGDVMPVILDHAGCWQSFGLPEEKREWDLHKRRDPKASVALVKREVDGRVVRMAPEEIAETLAKVTAATVRQTVCAGWDGPCPKQAMVPAWAFQRSRILRRQGRPWGCPSCTARKAQGARSPEQRSESARKRQSSRSPKQRSDAKRKAWHVRRAKALATHGGEDTSKT